MNSTEEGHICRPPGQCFSFYFMFTLLTTPKSRWGWRRDGTAGEKRGEEGGFFFSWLEETLKAIGGKTQVSFLQAMDFLMFRVLYDVLWVL